MLTVKTPYKMEDASKQASQEMTRFTSELQQAILSIESDFCMNKSKWEKVILIPTLYDYICSSMYGINIIGGKTGVLSSISLYYILDKKASRRGDVDASIVGQGCPITLCPGDPGLWLACGAALQGHTLSNQHLSVLGLDHKTWPGWKSRGEKGGEGRT